MSQQGISSRSSLNRTPHPDIYDRSVYTAGQALITVVNDPRNDNKGWGWGSRPDTSWQNPPPALDPIKYPNVTAQDFERYLRTVGDKHDQFVHDRDSLAEGLHQQLLLEGSGPGAQGDGLVQALAQVPAEYFQEGYSLQRPDIFLPLFDCQDDDELYNRIDHLSHCLDVVELQLQREIAAHSRDIFEGATSLYDLNHTLCNSLALIRSLRAQVSEMDESTYATAVHVTRLQRRRNNLVSVLDHLKDVEEVMSAKAALQCLLDSGDYAGALELLQSLAHSVEGLATEGIGAFRHMIPQVAETIQIVEQMLAAEFRSIMQYTEVHHVMEHAILEATAEVDASSASVSDMPLQSAASSSALPDMSSAREQLHDRLLPVVVGLYRADKLTGAIQHLKEHRQVEVKAIVREILERLMPRLLADLAPDDSAVPPENSSGAGPPASQSSGSVLSLDSQLSDKLQMLPHAGFMQILLVISRVIQAYIRHSQLIGSLCEEILAGLGAASSQSASIRKEVQSAVQTICDVSAGRWAKLLAARTNQHSRLKLYELKQLVDTSEALAAIPESHGCRVSPALKTAIQAQCKAYLEAMHSRSATQLQHLLEAEQWVVVEVPSSFQDIVDRLVSRSNSVSDGIHAHAMSPASTAANGNESAANGSDASVHNTVKENGTAPASGPQYGLRLGGLRFHMVNVTLILLKLIDEYLSLSDVVPQFGADIAPKTTDLLKQFNSQCCALVLGAGAMKTAGLKSISAKHLALACQAVNLLLHLLPFLRSLLLPAVPTARRALVLPEFERLHQDLSMHVDEIHTKLVDIMQDRLLIAARQLTAEAESWGAPMPSNSAPPQPSQSIATLAKQLATLRAVLEPLLLPEEVQRIFGRVASVYSETLSGTLDLLIPKGDVEAWEARRQANTLYLLHSFQDLPLDPQLSSSHLSRLATFFSKHYGALPDLKAQPPVSIL